MASKPNDGRSRFVGTWRCADHFSDIRIKIKRKGQGLDVFVVDEYDAEIPEIFDVAWDGKQQEFSFATLWSSGRFIRYRFIPSLASGRLELTFSYVDQELWEKA